MTTSEQREMRPPPPPPKLHVVGVSCEVTIWAVTPEGAMYQRSTYTGGSTLWCDAWEDALPLPFTVQVDSVPRWGVGEGPGYSATATALSITGALSGVENAPGEQQPIDVQLRGASQLQYSFTPSAYGPIPPGWARTYDLTVLATSELTLVGGQSFSETTSVQVMSWFNR